MNIEYWKKVKATLKQILYAACFDDLDPSHTMISDLEFSLNQMKNSLL